MNHTYTLLKKSIVVFAVALVLVLVATLFFACDSGADRSPDVDEGNSALKNGVVKITSVSDGVQKYDGAEVYIEDEKLELYNVKVNNEHRWNANPQNRSDSGVGYFSLDGKTTVRVKVQNMTSCVVRPLSAGVSVECEDGEAKFIIKSAGNYSIEPNSDAKRAFFYSFPTLKTKRRKAETSSVLQKEFTRAQTITVYLTTPFIFHRTLRWSLTKERSFERDSSQTAQTILL